MPCAGVSLVMYVIALAILLRKRRKPSVNRPMLTAIILMWLLGTLVRRALMMTNKTLWC
jgi:hypothetical protein